MRPLAIIETNGAVALRLLGAIESAGFRAAVFPAAKPAVPLLRARHFALAVLDLAIDDLDPFALCRETTLTVPTIALAYGPDAEELCMRALESGADDCICRTFRDRELIARIRNVLRRADEPPLGREGMDRIVSEMRVRFDDGVQNLTAGEAAVLAALLDRAPRPTTTEEIAHALGTGRGTIESRIKSLRKKLGPQKLVSRGRYGYQLE